MVVGILGAAVLLSVVTVLLSVRASHRVNHVPLAASPRPVTVEAAASTQYRDSRSYVGAVAPWIEASVGPQFISAYVLTVGVRPGAPVSKGEVLATLDCADPSAATRAAEMQSKAVDARMRAAMDEAARIASMLDGGFVSPNESEQKSAVGASEQAQLQAAKANLVRASLDVRDCVLRAPFDGEVATRTFDPGAFVHPGASIVSVVDRSTVRVTVDAPEKDFGALAPGTVVRIEVLATGATISAPISRRAPKADPRTRTIHFEVDVADPDRRFPVDTTALVHVDVGAAVPATAVPLYAATLESGKARLFVVDGDVAHARTLPILGESAGELYLPPAALAPGTNVVVEGRELLSDGDPVRARVQAEQPDAGSGDEGGSPIRGGGYGRPL